MAVGEPRRVSHHCRHGPVVSVGEAWGSVVVMLCSEQMSAGAAVAEEDGRKRLCGGIVGRSSWPWALCVYQPSVCGSIAAPSDSRTQWLLLAVGR